MSFDRPVRVEGAARDYHSKNTAPGRGSAAVPCTQLRRQILIVEDDDLDFMILCRLLCASKHSVDRAVSLASAKLKIAADSGTIDLVITDLFLGDAYPVTMLDELMAACISIPLLVVSGCSRDFPLIRQRARIPLDCFDKNSFNELTFLAAVDNALRVAIARAPSKAKYSFHELGSFWQNSK